MEDKAKSFKQCRRSDPELGKCLQGAVLDAFNKMRTAGIPSLGVLPLEPLVVNDIKIDPGADGPVTLKLHFMNLKMHGIPDSNFIQYNADLNNAKLTTTAFTSKLWFEADYRADGKVLLLPVKGAGKCNVTLFQSYCCLNVIEFFPSSGEVLKKLRKGTVFSRCHSDLAYGTGGEVQGPFCFTIVYYIDLKTDAELKFKPEVKRGETFWIIQSFKNKFNPKKVTVFFDGLLKGDRRLSTGINKFLNDNWKIVFEELGPSFEASFGAVFKEITHRVFSRVPVNKIFLN
ncbi:hypothetical protein RUM43_010909 [Polyplax serrata]|uniref:Uncharacterized protein n=1 Tax=Polyplax serrata TaxID=468196 RepID=A0AAN8PDY1_POLSC